jgi:hypothetical protein
MANLPGNNGNAPDSRKPRSRKTTRARKKHSYYTDCRSGYYILTRPERYMTKGVDRVKYKSSWEMEFFKVCDGNPLVTKWAYEPFDISYYSPALMKQSLYRPDVYLEICYTDGRTEKWLIEIKPVAYSVVPTPPKPPPPGCQDPEKHARYQKRMAAYQRKSLDVATNYAKWEAAEAWCKENGVNWMIFNENNTRGLFRTPAAK